MMAWNKEGKAVRNAEFSGYKSRRFLNKKVLRSPWHFSASFSLFSKHWHHEQLLHRSSSNKEFFYDSESIEI